MVINRETKNNNNNKNTQNIEWQPKQIMYIT